MKVICIDGVNKGELPFDENGRIASKSDEIYEGEIYTVVGEYPTSGGLAYFLEERRKNAAYAASCFIPLSDKDEMENVSASDEVFVIYNYIPIMGNF